jgi:hypothetical protein
MNQLRDQSEKRGGQNEEGGFVTLHDPHQREIVRNGGEAVSRHQQRPAQTGGKGGEFHAQDDDKTPWQLCKWW